MSVGEREAAARNIRVFMQEGKTISALKALRTATGCGLMEAKIIVEALMPFITLVPLAAPSTTSGRDYLKPHVVVTDYGNGDTAVERFTASMDGDARYAAMQRAHQIVDVAGNSPDVIVACVVAQTKRVLEEEI